MSTGPTGAAALADLLRDLRRRVTVLDARRFSFAATAPVLETDLLAPLTAIADEALSIVAELLRCCESTLPGATDEGAEPELYLFDEDDCADAATPARVPPQLEVGPWQQVADLCFMALGDMRKARRQLDHAGQQHEERVVACDSARRKVRRALAAILDGIARAQGLASALSFEREVDVESAVAVRRLYAKFRGSLVACDRDDSASVRRSLRYAAVSFAVMLGSSDFSEVRMADRVTLRSLQSRILQWARRGAGQAEGARLYQDIVTTADLLRAINLRQELQVHDVGLARTASAALRRDGAKQAGFEAVVGRLRALVGHDDELDALLWRAFAGEPAAELSAPLAATLDRVCGEARRRATAGS